MEKDPSKAASLTLADVAFQKRQAAIVQGEAKYQALQQLIMEQLGVKPEDVSTDMPAGPPGAGEKKPSVEVVSAGGGASSAATPGVGGGGAPSPSGKGGAPKAGATKPFSPSATQQQQGKKK